MKLQKEVGRVMVALERDGGEEILSIIYSINIFEYINVFERIVFFLNVFKNYLPVSSKVFS